MVVLLEVSSISRQDLWSSAGFLVTSITEAILPRLLILAASSELCRHFPQFVAGSDLMFYLFFCFDIHCQL